MYKDTQSKMIKTLKQFYSFLFKYKKALVAFILALISASIIESLIPYASKLLIDTVSLGNANFLTKMVVLIIGLRIISNLLHTLARYTGDKALIPASRDARIKVFRQIQDLDFAFHVDKNTGSLISAFKRGDNAFFGLFENINIELISITISLGVTLFFFANISPIIAGLMFVVAAINITMGWYLIKLNIHKRTVFNTAEDKISGIITDNLLNYETVKFFAQEEKEETRLKKEFKPWIDKLWKYANSFRVMDIAIGAVSGLGGLAVLWISIKKLVAGSITTGDLVMIIGFTSDFWYQSFHLLFRIRGIANQFIDIKKYFSILDNRILIKDPEKPTIIEKIKGDIEFQDVCFDYPRGKKDALVNTSFKIKAGESIAFVGKSGAGKTTIIKLLLRFYDVNKGKILVDNIDIRDLTKAQLRSSIGIVPQEPILFNNTIGFNIAYGKSNVTKKEITIAAKMANIYDFIKELPDKYETNVGERGIKLSGGEKQRLAIARMLLTKPKIIIFDEATSNLDSESETLIQDALWKIAKNRTVLIIAHRFSTIRKADRIIVIENGKIAESGSHINLIKKKGVYHRFWKLQSQGKTTKKFELLGPTPKAIRSQKQH